MDMIVNDESPSQISDKLKDMLYAKSADKIETARPVVANSLFGDQEVEDEIARQIRIWDHYSYERDRADNFPLWFDQLDMLYHDIMNGNLENGKWIQTIDAVKESFPKPEGPAPE